MVWLKEHLILSAILVGMLMISTGLVMVNGGDTLNKTDSTSSWSGLGTVFNLQSEQTNRTNISSPEELIGTIQPKNPLIFGEIMFPNQEATPSSLEYEVDDIGALLSSITPNVSSIGYTESVDTLQDIYSFLPRGLMSLTPPTKERTPQQQALYIYGNTIGDYVESYENSNDAQIQVLVDFLEDPANPSKKAAAESVAAGLAKVGNSMNELETVPPEVNELHKALARGYVDLSTRISAIFKANSDEDRLQAINAYNARADSFAKTYVSLVTLFSVSGVDFSNNDPGRVFSFSMY